MMMLLLMLVLLGMFLEMLSLILLMLMFWMPKLPSSSLQVFLLVTGQLALVCGLIALFVLHGPTKGWVRRNAWAYYVSYAVFLVVYIAIACCEGPR